MLRRLADNRDEKSMAVGFRRKRFAFFQTLLKRLEQPIHILDIGGTEAFWKTMGFSSRDSVFVTLLNVAPVPVTLQHVESISGDARSIQAVEQSFDVAFSNSVIEHVGGYEDQRKMAKEVQRVAKRYFIQTPNRYFPIEPHFLFPYFQFLPVKVRIWLLQHFNLGWYGKMPDFQKARKQVEEIRLLSRREFAALFPDAEIYEETVLGLTKSFIAYGGWNESTPTK